MDRHPEYKYCIGKIAENDHWIYIVDCGSGWEDALYLWENEGPVEFMLRISDLYGWHAEKTKSGQYTFKEDPMCLVYWWDDLFGFTAELKNWDWLQEAISFIEAVSKNEKTNIITWNSDKNS